MQRNLIDGEEMKRLKAEINQKYRHVSIQDWHQGINKTCEQQGTIQALPQRRKRRTNDNEIPAFKINENEKITDTRQNEIYRMIHQTTVKKR